MNALLHGRSLVALRAALTLALGVAVLASPPAAAVAEPWVEQRLMGVRDGAPVFDVPVGAAPSPVTELMTTYTAYYSFVAADGHRRTFRLHVTRGAASAARPAPAVPRRLQQRGESGPVAGLPEPPDVGGRAGGRRRPHRPVPARPGRPAHAGSWDGRPHRPVRRHPAQRPARELPAGGERHPGPVEARQRQRSRPYAPGHCPRRRPQLAAGPWRRYLAGDGDDLLRHLRARPGTSCRPSGAAPPRRCATRPPGPAGAARAVGSARPVGAGYRRAMSATSPATPPPATA